MGTETCPLVSQQQSEINGQYGMMLKQELTTTQVPLAIIISNNDQASYLGHAGIIYLFTTRNINSHCPITAISENQTVISEPI